MSQISSFSSSLALVCEDGVLILWDLAQGESLITPSTEYLCVSSGRLQEPGNSFSCFMFPVLGQLGQLCPPHSWDTLRSIYCPCTLWECARAQQHTRSPSLLHCREDLSSSTAGDSLQPLPLLSKKQVILRCLSGPMPVCRNPACCRTEKPRKWLK